MDLEVLTDEQLVLSAKDGNSSAKNEIIKRYELKVKKYIVKNNYYLTNGDQNDLIQEEVITVTYDENNKTESIIEDTKTIEIEQTIEKEVIVDEIEEKNVQEVVEEPILVKEEKINEVPETKESKLTNIERKKCRFTFGYIWNGQEFDM